MITLTLTKNILTTNNAETYSKNLTNSIGDFHSIFEIFGKFCSVCRIFIKVFDILIIGDNLQCKIRFETHSGSMFEDEDKLYRELNIVIFKLPSNKIEFEMTRHS